MARCAWHRNKHKDAPLKTLQFSVDADGVALVAIDVPGRSMNVLVPELVDEIVRQGGRVYAVEPRHETLEDRFLQLLKEQDQ